MILEIIGSGGMGVIYKARQRSLDRIVALKVLASRLADDVNFVARFQREARAIAKVNHPNILAVYDVGADQGSHYMIMELVDGQSLAEMQNERNEPLPVDEVVNYMHQAAMGLEAAQASGIIHRDVKPENMMLTRKKVIKVADFGLAKEADGSQTSTDVVMGTPAFMSPEQCDGKKVDGRSDIYSLGGSFYKLVTGRLPFEAETAMSMMYRHKHEALIPPRELRPEIPEPISELIVRMMAKRRENRPQTMTDVLELLDQARKGLPPPPTPVKPRAIGAIAPESPQERQSTSGLAIVIPPPSATPSDEWTPPAEPPAATTIIPPPEKGARMRPAADRYEGGRMRVSRNESSRSIEPPLPQAKSGEDAYKHIARGDELLGRSDRQGALKSWRLALQTGNLDAATRRRVEEQIVAEIETRCKAGDSWLSRGALVEAGREYRIILDLDPKNEEVRAKLKLLDDKLAGRRTLVNDIRTALAGSRFEKALELWDAATSDLRDEGLKPQIDRIRNVILPSVKLCLQGERYNESGRIEQAAASFQDALRIDESCERARQGLREVEMKAQRIERLLKEGHQALLEHSYDDALKLFRPVLALYPGHPQATKSIAEACLAWSQELRVQGDLETALQLLEEACDADPQNRGITTQRREIKNLYERERSLLDRAAEAKNRGQSSEALRLWSEVREVNPANKRVTQVIQVVRRERRRSRLKMTISFVLFIVLAAGTAQGVIEYLTLKKARLALTAERFEEAKQKIFAMPTSFLFFQGDAEDVQNAADRALLRLAAEREVDASRWGEASERYERLAKMLEGPEAAEALRSALYCQVKKIMEQGAEFERRENWEAARKVYEEAKDKAAERKDPSGRLNQLEMEAGRKSRFADAMKTAVAHWENERKTEALEFLLRADELESGNALVHAKLAALNFDADKFLAAATQAETAVSAAGISGVDNPEKIREAMRALKEALKYKAGDKKTSALLRWAEDLLECLDSGMVLHPGTARLSAKLQVDWNDDERKRAFCVDRWEYPNQNGALPLVNATWLEARDLCHQQNKRLCTRLEWQDACRGADRINNWPYGLQARAEICNTQSTAVAPAGSFVQCVNSLGLFDMSGNVAEWVEGNAGQTDAAFALGGAFDSGAENASCSSSLPLAKQNQPGNRVGFRCCKNLKFSENR